MSEPIGLGVDVSAPDVAIPRHSSRRPTISPNRSSQADVPVSPAHCSSGAASVLTDGVDTRRAATDDHASRQPSTLSSSTTAPAMSSMRGVAANDSGFSRHDSLFSFGVSSSRNAAELKSLLGNSNSRLQPGATVLPVHGPELGKGERRKHAVSLEQAKARARVEVDIVLESDCFIEGGYMRGSVKLRVRKRQKKEAAVLLAEGKVRVIGFECIPGESDRHTFYQRASPLSVITDAYTGVYDSPPDSEGFSRAMEGVHILPFAMLLPIDDACGSAKGAATVQSGVTIRYIAMVSVKVKDSKTSKRSIAHFYRDCEVWPRMNPSVVLSNAPRPIQASTAKSLSVIGGGSKVKLTAMLHRLTWIAGQRCSVRIWITNETKKTIKSVALTLVRTMTLFKPKPQLNPGNRMSIDPDACQTATTHKVVAEELLERSHSVAKGHASAQGWWTGVSPGQEAQFSHWILIPPESLSIPRSRLVEVEYSIRVTVSAGALTPDVHVTLPIRIINFLSVDPTPSEPLLSPDGAYTRLVPYEHFSAQGSVSSQCDYASSLLEVPSTLTQGGRYADIPSLATAKYTSTDRPTLRDDVPTAMSRSRRIPLNTPLCKSRTQQEDTQDEDEEGLEADISISSTCTSESDSSMFSMASSSIDMDSEPSSAVQQHNPGVAASPTGILGNLDLEDDADSDDEVDRIVGTAQLDSGRFPESHTSLAYLRPASTGGAHDSESDAYEGCADVSDERDIGEDDRRRCDPGYVDTSLAILRQSARRRREERGPLRRRADAPGSSSVRGPRHIRQRASASLDIYRADDGGAAASAEAKHDACEDDEDDGVATPRLGVSASSTCPSTLSASVSGTGSISDSDSSSQSRQLPQPPPRPSQLSDIPTSVSALEAIRLSRLSAAPASSSSAHPSRSLPTTPTRAPISAPSRPPRPTYERSETDLPTLPATTGHQLRPTRALRQTGQSDCSIVQGRIAAFEERLKYSFETGAAYA